jgi:FAD synthetase
MELRYEMKKVICFGTFDILHLGHLNYFEQAKKYGDYLIVVIARDETKKKQNKKLTFNEQERLDLVKNLEIVDEAVLGNLNDHFQVIRNQKPNIICLGYDQPIKEELLKEEFSNLKIKVVRAKAFQPEKYKSSLIKSSLK